MRRGNAGYADAHEADDGDDADADMDTGADADVLAIAL